MSVGQTSEAGRAVAMVQQAHRRHESKAGAALSVDMSAMLDLLDEARLIAEAVDDMVVPVDDRNKSTLMGEMSRSLNRLADMLTMATGEAKMEYWRMKGFSDPRDA